MDNCYQQVKGFKAKRIIVAKARNISEGHRTLSIVDLHIQYIYIYALSAGWWLLD